MKYFMFLLLSVYGLAADLDVFLICGQSNAVGNGGPGAPRVFASQCLSYYNGSIFPANDPVGNAGVGSAWPAFTRAYYSACRRAAMVVPAAKGGSAQSVKGDYGPGHWDVGGTLVPASLSLLDSALLAAEAAGWCPSFRGILWSQGESDAYAIANGTETASEYKAALYTMWLRYRAVYPDATLYVFRTGDSSTPSPAFATIRQAQEDMVSYWGPSLSMRVVFRGASVFPSKGLQKADGHYTQQGYNLMGRVGAAAVLSDGLLSDTILVEGLYPNAVRTEFVAH